VSSFLCRGRDRLIITGGVDDEGNEHTRELGLVVARGPMLTLISPVDGSERIENPFMAVEG
jgi:U6 snRNA-associated Sm-like protein LSm7